MSVSTLRPSESRPATRMRREGGIALVIVIAVLVTLVIVAVPFQVSMRQGHERTLTELARSRASFEASLLLDHLKQYLARTHPAQENARWQQDPAARGAESDDRVDTLGEITPGEDFRRMVEAKWAAALENDPALGYRAQALKERGLGPMNDDRGTIWTGIVSDANARVNPNGASPYLLGNLLGAALLSEELDAGATDIPVTHLVGARLPGLKTFPKDGGYIRIGNEVIRYGSFDGGAFRNCERGIAVGTPIGDCGSATTWKKGKPVIDYTAWKLATHVIASHPGLLTSFNNLEDLKTIASEGTAGVLTSDRLERLTPFLTVWSKREAAEWLAGQLVMNSLSDSEEGTAVEVQLQDQQNPVGTSLYYNAGTLLRFTSNGRVAYQSVLYEGDSDEGQRGRYVTLTGPLGAGIDEEGLSFEGGRTKVEALAPYPININTAPIEVIYACLANLQLRGTKTDEGIVTPEKAWAIAETIVDERKGELQADAGQTGSRRRGPFRHSRDYGQFLERLERAGTISRAQRAALYYNSVNPHNALLEFGTAPWCFRTLDVYHIEARVAVNDANGEQIATARAQEVVDVGSDGKAAFVLDTQEDFEQRLTQGSGAKWAASYPYGVNYRDRRMAYIQPAMREPKAVRDGVYPAADRDSGEGDVRLEPARITLPGAVVAEHFDSSWYTEGWSTKYSGAWTHKVKGAFRGKQDDPYVDPFTLSFWWRSYSDANWTAFDCGMEQFQNRYAIFVTDSPDGGQELVFRVCASTLDKQGAEIYVPLERIGYKTENWYHIQVNCRGEDPTTMELFVDGVAVGRRRGVTSLATAVSESDTDLQVEHVEGFGPYGSLLIGTEIVEYENLSGDSFRDCSRGARGTKAVEWPKGTPVRLLGYSLSLLQDVPLGGSNLPVPLGKWAAVRADNYDDEVPIPLEGGGYGQAGGFKSDSTNITVQAVPIWQPNGNDDPMEAFGDRGLALLGCIVPSNAASGDPSTGGEKFGGWEVVYYTRSGSSFDIERYVETDWQPASEAYFLITRDIGGNVPWPAFLVPISVPGSDPGGLDAYLNPSDPTDEQKLSRYWYGDGLARVLLGTDTPVDQSEVILYSSIDTKHSGPQVLFVKDKDLAVPGGIVDYFFRQHQENVVNIDPTSQPSTPTDPTDPTTPPAPTPPPPEPVPPGGGDPAPDPTDPPKDPNAGPTGPGGGIPPGVRDPSDPPTTDPVPEPTDPAPTEPTEPTPTDPSPTDPVPVDPTQPTDPTDPLEPLPKEPEDPTTPTDPTDPSDPLEPPAPGDKEPPSDVPGGTTDPGARDPADGEAPPGGEVPPPSEPEPDGSGGGSSEQPDSDGTSPTGPFPPILQDPNDSEAPADLPVVPDIGWVPAGPLTASQVFRFRGVNGTWYRNHQSTGGADRNSRYLPCFRVMEGVVDSNGVMNTALGARPVGRNDRITLTDGLSESPTRISAVVRWGDDASNWVALEDFVESRIYALEENASVARLDLRGYPRVLKFPSGELPDEMPEDMEFARSTVSNGDVVTAYLDEVAIFRHPQYPLAFVADDEGFAEDATEIRLLPQSPAETLEGWTGVDRDCGLVSIDGELIAYRGLRSEGTSEIVLEDCERGLLGTQPSYHGRGAYGVFIPDFPISYLDGGITRDSASLPLIHTRGWPREGLVRITGENSAELIHFTRRTQQELLLPESLDADEHTQGRGLLRGRFGTDVVDHDSGAIVLWQPFRYWDRYMQRRNESGRGFPGVHDHPEASYLEFGRRMRSGYFHRLTWQEDLDGVKGGEEDARTRRPRRGAGAGSSATRYMDIVVLARFSPAVPWDSPNVVDLRGASEFGSGPATNEARSKDVLYVFDDPEAPNRLGLEAEDAEFRFFFVYRPGAFVPQDVPGQGTSVEDLVFENSWKQTPRLERVTLEYTNRTSTLDSHR